jgi:predicted transcriptional regulator
MFGMPSPLPTEAELEILRVLWARGPSTVREVHTALSDTSSAGYTTALKLMQIMAEKGLVRRDESQRSHVYRPTAPAQQTQKRLVERLMDRAFSGSASQLVMRALSVKRASSRELADIRALLDSLEHDERDDE